MNESRNDSPDLTNKNLIAYVLFLMCPTFAGIYSVLNWKSRHSRNIFVLICGYIGFTFVTTDRQLDSYYYKTYLNSLYLKNYSLSDYYYQITEGELVSSDYFQPFLTYLVSLFTNDSRVLFCIFGLIFGYFFAQNVYFVIDKLKHKHPKILIPLLILLLVLIPIWNINGVRFYTAAHIFLFGVLNFCYTGRKTSFLYLLFSCVMHFSFLIPILVFLVSTFINKKMLVVFLLIFLSTYFVSFGTYDIVGLLPKLQGPIGEKISGYTYEEYVENIKFGRANQAWFITWSEIGIKSMMSFLVLVFGFNFKRILNLKLERLLIFSVLMFGFTNILSVIPSLNRFYIIPFFVLTVVSIQYYQTYGNSGFNRFLVRLLIIPITLFLCVQVRLGMSVISPFVFVNNPILAPFCDFEKGIWDYF